MGELGKPLSSGDETGDDLVLGGPAAGDPEVRASIWPAIHPVLLDLIDRHRSTLIFVNSRRLAERLASRDIEQLLVARVPGYLPLRAGIPVPPGVTSAANLVVVSVDPARIVAEIALRKAELASWAKEAQQAQR